MSNATDNPSVEVLKAGGSGVFTNYIYKAIPLAFDESMSYYETLAGLRDYLEETVIPTVNNNAEAVAELQGLYEELNAYVDNYFNNLDVQEEINNKLDDLVADGTLTRIIGEYVQPLIDEQNQEIAEFKTSVNSQILQQNVQIQAVASGSPLVASSVAQMTDTTRVYVNTSDGNWYYYNGSQWTIGGVYQSTGIADNSIGLENLKEDVIDNRYTISPINVLDPFKAINGKIPNATTGILTDNANYWITEKIHLNINDDIRIYHNLNDAGVCRQSSFHRIFIYDTNDTYLSFQESNSHYTATQECYVILSFPNSSEARMYSSRFNLACIKFNETNPYGQIRYPFIPSTRINKKNIDLIVDYDNLTNSLKEKLPIINDLNFEIGTIVASTGLPSTETTRIRTILYNFIPKGTYIKRISNDVTFNILFYNINENGYITFLNATDWTNEYEFTESSIVMLVYRYNNNRTITDENMETLINSVEISSPLDVLFKFKDENTKTGTELEYYGEKIEINNKCYVSENIGIPTRWQDGCVYNNINFEFENNATFKVTNMETLDVYGTFNLDQNSTIAPHCNSACFGNEFYDSNDEFPLLYVNAYNNTSLPLGTCYVYRVERDSNNQFSTTLVQTITIGFTNTELWKNNSDTLPYGNFAVDIDHSYLYAFTLRDSLNATRFFKFKLPKLNDGANVTLQESDIIDYFDTQYQNFLQGCQYYENKIYSACGIDSGVANSSSIRVIDLNSKSEVSKIPTSAITDEPETIFFYNNNMVFGGSTLVYIDF